MKENSEEQTGIIPLNIGSFPGVPIVARVKDNTIEIVGIDEVIKEGAGTPDTGGIYLDLGPFIPKRLPEGVKEERERFYLRNKGKHKQRKKWR